MTNRLHLEPRHRKVLEALLRKHLPDVEVWACGSRVNGRSHDGSDLDLVLRGPGLKEIPAGNLADFEEALRESNIPFLVEARDWARLPERFHQEIEREHVALVAIDDRKTTNPNCDIVHTTLGNCAHLVRDPVQPSDVPPDSPYIGLEHIGEGSLHLAGQGTANDVESTKNRFRAGDTLFGKLRPYFRKVARAPFDGICSTDIWVVRPRNGVDQGFVHYCLASQHFVDFVDSRSEGTRMPRANWKCASEYAIKLPPLSEQRAIAHVLGALDDKIELNRRMNRTLEAMGQAIFKDWFVDFGPVRAKTEGREPYLPPEIWKLFPNRFVNSELGEIPEGWQLKPLDQIAHFRNGLALQKFRPSPGEARLPVVKIAQLRSGEASKEEWASASINPECIIDDGDIVFSWSGSLLVRMWCGGRAALNQHLFKVSSEKYPKWYYLHSILSHFPDFQRIAADKATTMGHIRRHHLSDALCVAPSQHVIAQMTGLLGGLIEQQTVNHVTGRTLAELRDLLLPKLISGQIRLRDSEKLIEKVG